MEGWIKIHRKLLENPIFANEKGLKIWIWCLLKANHEENEFYLGRIKIKVGAGQFVYGRDSASRELKMKASTIRDYIQLLKTDSYIDINSTNKYSLITICKWNSYQVEGQQKRQQTDNKSKTNQKQMDTNNNDKNDNNKTVPTSKTSLTACTDEELKAIALSIGVSLQDVTRTHEIILNKIAAREFKGKTVYHSLRNWILMGIERGTIKVNTRVTPGYRVVNG